MIIKVASTPTDIKTAFSIRTEVFVKEQKVPMSLEIDAYDNDALHFIGYHNEIPVAASRLRCVDDYGKLERICVLKSYRGLSYGQQIIIKMETEIKTKGYNLAVLNAQIHAIPFYKQLGYQVCSEQFLDAGMPHVTMKKGL